MPDIPFTPEQTARLREICGLRPWDRELSPADLLVITETREIIEREFRRWSGGPP